jgi:outer membrane protein OmpA-like peptidoglycan-associated protein
MRGYISALPNFPMAETTGKCTNFASCTLAYRNEPIPYTGNPVCPECGQPLTTRAASKGPSPTLLIAGGAGALILLAGGLYFAFSRPKTPPAPIKIVEHTEDATPAPSAPAPEPEPASTPTPSTPAPAIAANTPVTAPDSPPSTPTPSATPAPSSAITGDQLANPVASLPSPTPATSANPSLMPAPQSADSAEPVSVVKAIDTNIKGDENLRIRTEVLKRIDLMPNLSPGDKEKLYARVDRAHGMGKVINIPFAMGSRAVGPKEVEQLKSALQSPPVASLIKDPTVVFVLLGFADKRGDEKMNQKISLDRAENISQTLKEKCGMQNVTQPVGMGGSALFDSGNFAKNRVVEVWAVVP